MPKYVVARQDEIPANTRKLVEVRGRKIAIFNVNGELFGILNRCPHQGGNLCRGRLIGLVESDSPGTYEYSRPGEILRCPWHGWEFDLRTGLSRSRPDECKVRKFPVEVQSIEPDTEIAGTEIFTVEREGKFITVSME